VAGSLAELPEQRKYARWWEWLPAPVRALEGASLREDPTIRRLDAEEIDRNRDLRTFVESYQIEPEDLLVYMAYAEGGFGRYRLAAIFLLPPDIAPPTVCCLDGHRRQPARGGGGSTRGASAAVAAATPS
jgi:hypothetical protein